MLTDTEELEAAWNALAGQKSDRGILSVALGHSGPRFRGGIMFPEASEVLLVGFDVDIAPPKAQLPEGFGFRVEVVKDASIPGCKIGICLVRHPEGSRGLFVQMAADVVAAVSGSTSQSEAWLLTLMLARIRAWQDFMRRPKSERLTQEEEIGLFGELSFLRSSVTAGAVANLLVPAWVGPRGGLQDFQTDTVGIEIKSTTSANGFPAQISSLEQLDSLAGRAILLAAMRLCEQQSGETLPELIFDLRGKIAHLPAILSSFDRALLLAGYEPQAEALYIRRMALIEMRILEVDQAFPCLVRSSIPPAIRAATYEIDLELVNGTIVSHAEALSRCGVVQA